MYGTYVMSVCYVCMFVCMYIRYVCTVCRLILLDGVCMCGMLCVCVHACMFMLCMDVMMCVYVMLCMHVDNVCMYQWMDGCMSGWLDGWTKHCMYDDYARMYVCITIKMML